MYSIQITGILAILGAFIAAISDALLLAAKVNIDDYPKLKSHQILLSGAEKMVVLPPTRMMCGALAGVFASPLIISGFWQIYLGLSGSDEALRVVTVILFATGSVIGAFVHGSFFYAGEYVKALNDVGQNSQKVIIELFTRYRKVMIISYVPVLLIITLASLLFSIMAASRKTMYPAWMAAVNPVTLTIAWLLLKRILPLMIRDITEGAGFNIAYLIFFVCSTTILWQA